VDLLLDHRADTWKSGAGWPADSERSGSGSGWSCVDAGATVERRKGLLLAEYYNPKMCFGYELDRRVNMFLL
jgi:hypothetical protein